MKTLIDHINEALKIGKNLSSFSTYSCQPKTKQELTELIDERVSRLGSDCDLNDIDVSLIDDMSKLFYYSDFIGDISKWDVSNVEDMHDMFADSLFNGDISKWNTSKVIRMDSMFAESKFNQPIGDWDVSNVIDMQGMFALSKFNQDISNWKIRKDCNTMYMLLRSSIRDSFVPKSMRC